MKDDQEIIEAIQSKVTARRTQAFEKIYDQNYYKIELWVTNNNGAVEDAKDIFQDGVVILYRSLMNGTFKGTSKIGTYLYGICKNLWLQHLRTSKRQEQDKSSLIVDNIDECETLFFNMPLFKSVFNELKNDCKELLAGFYFHKMSMKEIQLNMNMNSEQVVRNKKGRCMKYLMNTIQKKGLKKEHFLND